MVFFIYAVPEIINPLNNDATPEFVTSKVPRTYKFDRKQANVHILPGITSVVVPHSISYNPLPNAHADLVKNAAEIFLEEEKVQAQVNEIYHAPLASRKSESALYTIIDDDFGEEEENPDNIVPQRVATHPITKAEKKERIRKMNHRNRLRAAHAKKALLESIEKYSLNMTYFHVRVPDFLKELQPIEKSDQSKINPERVRLGRFKYKDPFPAVALPEDLRGSARLIKPAGSLVTEQYSNFQRRNLIEAKVHQTYAFNSCWL